VINPSGIHLGSEFTREFTVVENDHSVVRSVRSPFGDYQVLRHTPEFIQGKGLSAVPIASLLLPLQAA
jgi:hypothetical protein